MKPLEIQGQLRKYHCEFFESGLSYAKIRVYTKDVEAVSLLFGMLSFERTNVKKVWAETARGYNSYDVDQLNRMLPDQLIELYTQAVRNYEEYTIAWDKQRKGQDESEEDEYGRVRS